jgi:hypothetical protein
MSNKRVWLFRGLVLVGLGLILVSWFSVWWRAEITMLNNWVQIRPYALEMDKFIKGYLPGAKLPDWLPPFVWTYFASILVCLAVSLFAKEKILGFGKIKFSLTTWLILYVGVSFIVCAVTAMVFASLEMSKFYGMTLLGEQTLEIDPESHSFSAVYPKLEPGYYLAYVAGVYSIVLAFLGNRIKGKTPSSAQ